MSRFDEATLARHAEMLGSRLRKRLRHLRERFEKRGIGAFRIHD